MGRGRTEFLRQVPGTGAPASAGWLADPGDEATSARCRLARPRRYAAVGDMVSAVTGASAGATELTNWDVLSSLATASGRLRPAIAPSIDKRGV